METPFLVYALVDPRNGQRFYIGQSSIGMERPRQHTLSAGLKESTPKAKHVNKLLAIGVEIGIEVLQYVRDPDEAVPPMMKFYTGEDDVGALDDAEQRWIAFGRAAGWPLKNILDGGDGLRGLPRTPEHCAKISASRIGNQWSKGIPKTPEHRAKLSAALKGKERSLEHAAKISAANRGKPKHTEEHKQKLRERWLGADNPTRGKKATPELRAKLSAAHNGVQIGPKNPNYGKTMSAEQRAKISASKRANPLKWSDEAKAKFSERISGENHPMFGKHHSQEAKDRISHTKRCMSTGAWLALTLAGVK